MADVRVVSHHNGGRVMSMSGDTPLSLAEQMDLSTSQTEITVNEQVAQGNQPLHDGDTVAFQKQKMTSGK